MEQQPRRPNRNHSESMPSNTSEHGGLGMHELKRKFTIHERVMPMKRHMSEMSEAKTWTLIELDISEVY